MGIYKGQITLINVNDGNSGESGIGIKQIKQLYLLTASSTQVPNTPDKDPNLPWSDKNPSWDNTKIQYLWICTEVIYSNNTKEYTTPYTDNNWKTAVDAVDNKYSILQEQIDSIQGQIDSAIETWYIDGPPDINNPPWGSIEENETHVGDLYYDTASGLSYRFLKKENGSYEWKPIADSDISEALQQIESLRKQLDEKVAIFYSEEDPLLNNTVQIDDLWIQPDGNFYQCVLIDNKKTWALANVNIEKISVQYSKNKSNTIAPENSWKEETPIWEEGYYIWQRTVTYYKNNAKEPSYSEPVCISAAAAKGIIISGEQVFKSADGINFLPNSIILNATIQGNLVIEGWYYKNNESWYPLGETGLTYEVESASGIFSESGVATIKVQATDDSYYDIISIYKVSDGQRGADGEKGEDGQSGASASSVFLTNENITFAANAIGQIAAKTTTCNVVAYTGSTKVTPIIGNIAGAPSGMSITKGTIIDNEIPIIIEVDANSTLGGMEEQSGTLEIPVTSPVSTILKINWSKVNSGADGEKGEDGKNGETFYTWIRYADDEKGSNMSEFPQNKKYIGISNNQSNPNPSSDPNDYTWSLFQGENGVGVSSTQVFYAISKDGTVPPIDISYLYINENGLLSFEEESGTSFILTNGLLFSENKGQINELNVKNSYITGSGETWSENLPEVPKGFYLWTKTVFHYSDGTQNAYYSNSYHGEDGIQGPQGEKGEDANKFMFDLSQTEILKFVDSVGNTTISPEILRIALVKNEPFSEEGRLQITNLNINNFIAEIYNVNSGSWEAITGNNIITIDENFSFNIDLKRLIESGNEKENLAANQLLFNECILKISYIHIETLENAKETYKITDFLNVRYGMNKDMASLSVKANGIVASMQDSKLVFNASGLIVQNGAFVIKDQNGNNLLYSDNGNLALKGNIYAENGYFKGELQGATGTFSGALEAASGTFIGKLEAATGSFSGDISAASGTIGGFKIDATRLISIDSEDNPSIILDGSVGIIEAENIVLGIGAQIKEYIKIGEQVELRKAATSNDSFIKVTNNENKEILSLKANGTMNIGNGENTIILSGSDGSIVSQNYQDGLGWKISNTHSVFNDVTIRGSIRASVLEYGETQAIGGALLVRPSSRILSAILDGSNTILELEEVKGFNIGDYCRIDTETLNNIEHNFYQIQKIDGSKKQIIIIGDASNSYGKPIINFGKTGDNVGICINGSIDDSFSTPQSISVFEFNPDTKIIYPRIVLGKLPNEQSIYGYAAGTYGLYAENVLLKGSLVTQTDTNNTITYSGISTLYSGVDAPTSHKYKTWFGDNTGEILLWAGATGTTKEEVENSNFFVDRNGNLFAGSGYFKGTIITDATITASEIETAIIRGSNEKPGEPALRIEDAAKGIHFSATIEDGEKITVFEVTKDSIIANVPNFKFNSNFTIGGNGSLIVPNLYVIGDDIEAIDSEESGTQALTFDKHRISYTENFKQNELLGSIKGYIDFTSDLSFSPDGVNEVFQLSGQEIRAKTSLYLEESVKYGELMEYKPVYDQESKLIGYDLYIE